MFEKNIFDYVEEGKDGDFELIHKVITEKDVSFLSPYKIGDRITVLKQGSEVVMSNTNMEKHTNTTIVHEAHGDVLIAGLGIGMILLEIQKKDEVNSITVIEKNEEVIRLMSGLPLNDKVTIINDDIFNWKPKKLRFDTIYFDIWNYVNSDIYEEMKKLKTRYRRYLKPKKDNPKRHMSCWAEWNAKNNARLF